MTRREARSIDVELMKSWCHPVAVALFGSDGEPVGAFEEHDRSRLESALNNPRHTFDGLDLYPTIEQKAAILYYSLIKNHPFINGNKRVATATLLAFLFINELWVPASHQRKVYLKDLAIHVASSEGSKDQEALLAEISDWLARNKTTLDVPE